MAAPRPVRVPVDVDEQAAATRELAAEVRKLRMSVRAGIRQVQPACTAVRGLCAWWKKWGPWLLGSIPGVLVGVQALSPSAAEALGKILGAIAKGAGG